MIPEIKPKIALYPGSFNPWHKGHEDVLKKALQVFDKVIIATLYNPEKDGPQEIPEEQEKELKLRYPAAVNFISHPGFLVDLVKKTEVHAVIRGLRNGHDLQYEMNLQYTNEDLGLEVPTVYYVTDRSLSHISSSAIRQINYLKKKFHE